MSTNIQYLGSLSGSLDLTRYVDRDRDITNGFTPGIAGRVTLQLDAGGSIPGVEITGDVLLEVNLFLGRGSRRSTINTFLTRGRRRRRPTREYDADSLALDDATGAPGRETCTIAFCFGDVDDAGRGCTS